MVFNTLFSYTEGNLCKGPFVNSVVDTPYPLDTKSILARYVRGESIECVSNSPRPAMSDTFANSWLVRDRLALAEKIAQVRDHRSNLEKDYNDQVQYYKDLEQRKNQVSQSESPV
ncbi:hypothetical protein [Capybara microvirus Cap1_SP_92]|nr:hypothetical protein [Capybara microvirus Cap1_SP_92]